MASLRHYHASQSHPAHPVAFQWAISLKAETHMPAPECHPRGWQSKGNHQCGALLLTRALLQPPATNRCPTSIQPTQGIFGTSQNHHSQFRRTDPPSPLLRPFTYPTFKNTCLEPEVRGVITLPPRNHPPSSKESQIPKKEKRAEGPRGLKGSLLRTPPPRKPSLVMPTTGFPGQLSPRLMPVGLSGDGRGGGSGDVGGSRAAREGLVRGGVRPSTGEGRVDPPTHHSATRLKSPGTQGKF